MVDTNVKEGHRKMVVYFRLWYSMRYVRNSFDIQ